MEKYLITPIIVLPEEENIELYSIPVFNDISVQTIKEKLCETQDELFSLKDSEKYMKKMKPFDYAFKKKIAKQFGYYKNPKPITVAWLKMYEIATQFDLFSFPDDELRYFDNAAFPGAFIIGSYDYIQSEKSLRQKQLVWKASSALRLNGREELKDTYSLYKNYNSNFLIKKGLKPEENPGDVTDYKNTIEFIKEQIGDQKVHVYTSDLGLPYIDSSCTEIKNIQEKMHILPNLGQILSGLLILDKGGNMVIKMYTFFDTISFTLIGLLSTVFEELFVYKPISSTASNSEIYVVGKSFKGEDDAAYVIDKLTHHIKNKDSKNPLYSLDTLHKNEPHMINLLQVMSQLYEYKQVESLEKKMNIIQKYQNENIISSVFEKEFGLSIKKQYRKYIPQLKQFSRPDNGLLNTKKRTLRKDAPVSAASEVEMNANINEPPQLPQPPQRQEEQNNKMNKDQFILFLHEQTQENIQRKEIVLENKETEEPQYACLIGKMKGLVWVRLHNKIVSLSSVNFETGTFRKDKIEKSEIKQIKTVFKEEYEIVYPDETVLENIIDIFDKEKLNESSVSYGSKIFRMLKENQKQNLGIFERGLKDISMVDNLITNRYINRPIIRPIVQFQKSIFDSKNLKIDRKSKLNHWKDLSFSDELKKNTQLKYSLQSRWKSPLFNSVDVDTAENTEDEIVVGNMPIFTLRKISKYEEYEPHVFLPEETLLRLNRKYRNIEPNKSKQGYTCHGTGKKNTIIEDELKEDPEYLRSQYFPPLYPSTFSRNSLFSIQEQNDSISRSGISIFEPESMQVRGYMLNTERQRQTDVSIMEPYVMKDMFMQSNNIPRHSNLYDLISQKQEEHIQKKLTVDKLEEDYSAFVMSLLKKHTFVNISELYHFMDTYFVSHIPRDAIQTIWNNMKQEYVSRSKNIQQYKTETTLLCTTNEKKQELYSLILKMCRTLQDKICSLKPEELDDTFSEFIGDFEQIKLLMCSMSSEMKRNEYLQLSYEITKDTLRDKIKVNRSFPEELIKYIEKTLNIFLKGEKTNSVIKENRMVALGTSLYSFFEIQDMVRFCELRHKNIDSNNLYVKLVNHIKTNRTYRGDNLENESMGEDMELLIEELKQIQKHMYAIEPISVKEKNQSNSTLLPTKTLDYILSIPDNEERTTLLSQFVNEFAIPKKDFWYWKKNKEVIVCCAHELVLGKIDEEKFIEQWSIHAQGEHHCRNCGMKLYVGTMNTGTFEETQRDMTKVSVRKVEKKISSVKAKIFRQIGNRFAKFSGIHLTSEHIQEIMKRQYTTPFPFVPNKILVDFIKANTQSTSVDVVDYYLFLTQSIKKRDKKTYKKMIKLLHAKTNEPIDVIQKRYMYQELGGSYYYIVSVIIHIYTYMIYSMPSIRIHTTSKYSIPIPLYTFADYSNHNGNLKESPIVLYLAKKASQFLQSPTREENIVKLMAEGGDINNPLPDAKWKYIDGVPTILSRLSNREALFTAKEKFISTKAFANNTIIQRPSHVYRTKSVLSDIQDAVQQEKILITSQNINNACTPLYQVQYGKHNLISSLLKAKPDRKTTTSQIDKYLYPNTLSNRKNRMSTSAILSPVTSPVEAMKVYKEMCKMYTKNGKKRNFAYIPITESIKNSPLFRSLSLRLQDKVIEQLNIHKEYQNIILEENNMNFENNKTRTKFSVIPTSGTELKIDINTFETETDIMDKCEKVPVETLQKEIDILQKNIYSSMLLSQEGQSDETGNTSTDLFSTSLQKINAIMVRKITKEHPTFENINYEEIYGEPLISYSNKTQTESYVKRVQTRGQCLHEIYLLQQFVQYIHQSTKEFDTVAESNRTPYEYISKYKITFFIHTLLKEVKGEIEKIPIPRIHEQISTLTFTELQKLYTFYFFAIQEYIRNVTNTLVDMNTRKTFLLCVQNHFDALNHLDNRTEENLNDAEQMIKSAIDTARQNSSLQKEREGTLEAYKLFRSYGLGNIMEEDAESENDFDPLNRDVENEEREGYVIQEHDGYDHFDENADIE